MTETNIAAPSADQPTMTLNTMVRGIVVRVAIASVFIAALMWASYIGIDRIPVPELGGEVRIFSLFGILTVIRFFHLMTKGRSLALYALIGLALLPVMVFQMDRVPYLPEGMDISLLSLMGVVLIHYPFAIALLWFYQHQANRTRKRINQALADLKEGNG